MSNSPKPASFDDFLRRLAESRPIPLADSAPPSSDVLAAANLAWRETQFLRSAGQAYYHEDLEMMAAADLDNGAHPVPRLRTSNGFVISALHAGLSPRRVDRP